jgi:DNA-binding NtrC family response regulator
MPRTPSNPSILLVDDDPDVRGVLSELLSPHYTVREAVDAASALAAVKSQLPGVILLDLHLGDGPDGFWVLERLKQIDPTLPVVILSIERDTESVVRAMKAGAAHYISKTPRYDELLERLRLAFEERARAMSAEAHRLPSNVELVGVSSAIESLRQQIAMAARAAMPVLVLGETGTGKGLVARAIHQASSRRDKPFRDVNVAGLPSSVIDSELFGHERGAFTGAERLRRGLFELAAGGTLLLDEIGDLSRELQVKLLKVVDDGSIRRIGSDDDVAVDVRIVAATHRDLPSMVGRGTFRDDLYHRLAGLVLTIPPLRTRLEDIEPLVRAFLGADVSITPEAVELLRRHDWPGNVRELLQVVRRAVLFAHDRVITPQQLSIDHSLARQLDPSSTAGLNQPYHDAAKQQLQQFQRRYLTALLERCGGNVSKAARESQLSRTHLHAMISELGLKHSSDEPE